jgi:hypothetical protein
MSKCGQNFVKNGQILTNYYLYPKIRKNESFRKGF